MQHGSGFALHAGTSVLASFTDASLQSSGSATCPFPTGQQGSGFALHTPPPLAGLDDDEEQAAKAMMVPPANEIPDSRTFQSIRRI